MNIKKVLALLSVTATLFSLAGCQGQDPTTVEGTTVGITTRPPLRPTEGYYSVNDSTSSVIGGQWNTSLRPDNGGSVTYNNTYAGTFGKDYSDPAYYTYRESISSTGGLKWAPHTWETSADSYILNYTTTGFYRFAPNSDLSGWTIVDEMAVGAPGDVTKDFVGRFGITESDTARAWEIRLDPNACWENGVPINADTYLYSYQQLLDGKMMNRRADAVYAGEFSIVGAKDYLYGNANWEDVGIVKTGEYTIVLITDSPIADPDFYVPYYLTDTFLVYEPLWESCKTYFDKDGNQVSADSDNISSITTNYCTSLSTSISYGPYKLTDFQRDKSITLKRNTLWHGYSDGKHFGQYQADEISCQVISDQSTALLAFLSGDLDSITLSASDMEKYAASDFIRYTPQTYTTKLTFNTDVQALSARGTQILSNVNFRRGLSLAIDRMKFAAEYTSAGVPGFGLLNDMYIYDPYENLSYRSSDPAKNALVQLYGLTYGVGGDYPTLDDAYNAITGFDLTLARQYMQQAYEEAVSTGLYDGSSVILLELSVYQKDDTYTQMFFALSDALESACKGTDLEGKVALTMTADEDYYASMESGLTDIIFSSWGGSAYDPYGLLYNCYCDGGIATYPNQMEFGFESSALDVTITLDGTAFTASLQDWARWCAGEYVIISNKNQALVPFRTLDAYSRCAIYADLEWAYLSQAVAVPLYYRNSATLVSQKGDHPTRNYLPLAQFGGIAFYTFDYDDIQWDSIKGNLQY